MKLSNTIPVVFAFFALSAFAQDRTMSNDHAVIETSTAANPLPMHRRTPDLTDGVGTPGHPYTIVARHPKAGCADTQICGEQFYEYHGHNIRTSAGTTWQYGQMAGGTAAVGTYIALSATAYTPVELDTTVNTELTLDGMARALATPANASTTLAVPAAPVASVVGAGGAVTYYYWVAACNQGICTTPSLVSNTITTAATTLSTILYDSIAFTGQNGASSYQVYRTTSNTAPSGTVSVLVGNTAYCTAALACVVLDQSNTLGSVTIPGSNLTNFGKYTLVNTWTCATAPVASIQAFGVLNAASVGTLVFEGIFTPVSLNVGDTLQLTESVFF